MKKLKLNKETLVSLDASAAATVAGGDSAEACTWYSAAQQFTCNYVASCGPCRTNAGCTKGCAIVLNMD